MRKNFRKSLSLLMALCMMVLSILPTTAYAAFSAIVYDDAETGISIELGRSYDPTNGKTVTFTVVVDNTTKVESIPIEGVPADNVDLVINADGYTVTFPSKEGCDVTSKGKNTWLLDLKQIIADSYSLTINLASEKTQAAIKIADSKTTYGTFHWQKNSAGNTAFQRELTVYVNEEEKYTQVVNTPKDLTNGGVNDQYWFIPNTEYYKSECEIRPPYALGQVTNKNLSVYLTTKCGCGLDTCLCEGGCDCPVNCPCPDCTGENLTDTQIPTPYGLIEYKKPTASGYNLTVEIYVNGQKEFVTGQLRVKSGEDGCLNFTPGDGYYYHYVNGYDLDTKNSGSSWDQNTGYLLIVGALGPDRDYPNCLKIYLWTFEQGVQLDVERRPWDEIEHNVTGYIISYAVFNPKTDREETYTYEATSFLVAQSQRIPIGTKVTLTAICEDGMEVTQWSTADGYANATFTGIRGNNGRTEAYGNTAYLTVNTTAVPRVTVYIDEIGQVVPPLMSSSKLRWIKKFG